MRPSLLYAPMLIALPGALARVMISFSSTSEDASLSIFGVNGPRTSLHFYTTGDHENPYVLTSADQDAVGMDTRLGLKPGHAAFTHTSDGKHVNVSLPLHRDSELLRVKLQLTPSEVPHRRYPGRGPRRRRRLLLHGPR